MASETLPSRLVPAATLEAGYQATHRSADQLPQSDLRDYCGHHARFWTERLYGEAMIRAAGPERLRHLEQVIANDGRMAALARRARARMQEPSRG